MPIKYELASHSYIYVGIKVPIILTTLDYPAVDSCKFTLLVAAFLMTLS